MSETTTTPTLAAIRANAVYQQVLKDSYGGVLYNVANRGKYDTTALLELWNNLPAVERNSVDGIMSGAMNFIQGN